MAGKTDKGGEVMAYGLDPEIHEEKHKFFKEHNEVKDHNEMEDKTMLRTYVTKNKGGYYTKTGRVLRQPNRMKKGLMVALPMGDKVRIGWALCNFSEGDVYSHAMAMNIATGRAERGSTDTPAASMIKPLAKFINRATRYYKDKEIECTFELSPPVLPAVQE